MPTHITTVFNKKLLTHIITIRNKKFLSAVKEDADAPNNNQIWRNRKFLSALSAVKDNADAL